MRSSCYMMPILSQCESISFPTSHIKKGIIYSFSKFHVSCSVQFFLKTLTNFNMNLSFEPKIDISDMRPAGQSCETRSYLIVWIILVRLKFVKVSIHNQLYNDCVYAETIELLYQTSRNSHFNWLFVTRAPTTSKSQS